MLIGAAMLPLLSIQYQPKRTTTSVTVGCSWSNASAQVMEREVISKIEGSLAQIEGLESIRSISNKGSGYVILEFKKGVKLEVARFEASYRMRQLYSKLPEGVSYPSVSGPTSSDQNSQLISFVINSSLSSKDIEDFITDQLTPPLAKIEGVNNITYSGITPWEYEIATDPEMLRTLGLSMSDISSAFSSYFSESTLGNLRIGEHNENIILVKVANAKNLDFASIPIRSKKGELFSLGSLSTVTYRESKPQSFYRVNGLSTIYLNVEGERGANVLAVAADVKSKMRELAESFPDGLSMTIGYDASENINKELNTIFVRTLFTLAILLLFIYISSRNLKYLFIITTTLIANILVAVIFYNIFKIDIHIYSLAGFTVSLGIIIDTSIIMVDHYSYYYDKKAFSSILGAILTTVAALTVVFLLPEQQQLVFGDFSFVIIINLLVSLAISYMFIPSLIRKVGIQQGHGIAKSGRRGKRRILRFNRIYERYILWSRRHRWIYIVALILGFGIPLNLLPTNIKAKRYEELSDWAKFYNKTIGGEFYQNNKEIFEKVLGGSVRIFKDPIGSAGQAKNVEPGRKTLTIRAGMIEGNTASQLNQIIRHMENFLTQFDGIETFRTTVSSFDNGTITVNFTPEAENTSFPVELKRKAIREVLKFGGATWSVYGVDNQAFNNKVASDDNAYKPYRITLTGYNYDKLLVYAEELKDTLTYNRRVKEPGVFGEVAWQMPKQEPILKPDTKRILMAGISPNSYLRYLRELTYDQNMTSVFTGQHYENVILSSLRKNDFDLWHVKNFPLDIDSVKTRLIDIGDITKERSGLNIHKKDQAYELTVAFDFIGSYELGNRVIESHIERMNDILPVGYRARNPNDDYWGDTDTKGKGYKQILLVLLVIGIIYAICTIMLESFIEPLIIILMIPISFIGIFLIFGLFGFRFDQGGFASFIFISGIVVNTGIYLINEYNIIRRKNNRLPARTYVKSYNRKIMPIMLTIVSTILGLVPFIYKGSGLLFWYPFAIGTIGGMAFSIVSFLIYLPIFLPLKPRKQAK